MTDAVTDEQTTPPPALAFAVTSGGAPTPEQLAALSVVLTAGSAAADDTGSDTSAWQYAALREAIGHRPFWSADDLAGGRFKI